ncbi:MAG: cytoplasmic protein [Bacteroidota bacterium]
MIMQELYPIKVEAHSGYEAYEYPKRFQWNDEWFDIEEIIDRWFQGDKDPNVPASDYFKVKAQNGKVFLLKHTLEKEEWMLTPLK